MNNLLQSIGLIGGNVQSNKMPHVKIGFTRFMKIAIAADHAGFALKEKLRQSLAAETHELVDYGTGSADGCDYPDFAQPVSRDVAQGRSERGVLVFPALGARYLEEDRALDLIHIFPTTGFTGGRHARRVAKLEQ